jgi:hypothetical protein
MIELKVFIRVVFTAEPDKVVPSKVAVSLGWPRLSFIISLMLFEVVAEMISRI